MKDRIKRLLASGLKASEVASIVGCSPAYVSQLLKDEDFRKSVEELMLSSQEEQAEEVHIAKRYEKVEHKILNKMEEAIEGAELPQLTRALEVIGKRRDEAMRPKGITLMNPMGIGHVNGNVNVHVTQIALPSHELKRLAPQVQKNESNEIIAINNKPLAPMSSTGVKNIFEQMNPSRNPVLMNPDVIEVPNDVLSEL